MTTLQDAETTLAEARGKLTRITLGKLDEADAYRAALNEARANAYMHPNDVNAAERVKLLEIAETEARWAVVILRFAADIASDTATALLGDGLDAHGAAKAADTLEGKIAEMTERVDNLAAIFADDDLEGDAAGLAHLEGQTTGLIIAACILGKAAQAMRDAADNLE